MGSRSCFAYNASPYLVINHGQRTPRIFSSVQVASLVFPLLCLVPHGAVDKKKPTRISPSIISKPWYLSFHDKGLFSPNSLILPMSEYTAVTSGQSTSLNDGTREATEGQKSSRSRVERKDKHQFSSYTKLGLLATCILNIGLTFLLASVGFLWFLWLADSGNRLWRAIAARNWVTRAITLSSLAVRQSVSFQSSVATAMIASLVLEHAVILLLNLASVSVTRNANAGPYMLF